MVIGTNAFDAPSRDRFDVLLDDSEDSLESDGFSDVDPPRTAPLVGTQGSVSTVWNTRPSAVQSRGFLPSLSQSQNLTQQTERTLWAQLEQPPVWLGPRPRPPLGPVPDILLSTPDADHLDQRVLKIKQLEDLAQSEERNRRYVSVVELCDQAIALRRELLGEEHADVVACHDRCITASLTYGLEALKNGQMTAALTLLKKVEANTHVKHGSKAPVTLSARRRGELRAEGFAALASYYKVRGKNKEAIAYADKAFQAEQKFSPNQARMRLILATLLSVAGRQTTQVVAHYEKAIALLQDALRDSSDLKVAEELVVANYNLWIEGVKQRVDRRDKLLHAANFALKELGPDHVLTRRTGMCVENLNRLDGLRMEMSTHRRSSRRSSTSDTRDVKNASSELRRSSGMFSSKDEKDIVRKKQHSISLEDTLSTAVPGSVSNSRMLQNSWTMQSTTLASQSQQPSTMKSSWQQNSLNDMSFSFSHSFHPVLPASQSRGKPRRPPGPVVPARQSQLLNRIIMDPARRATENAGHPPQAKTKARSIFSVVYEARQGYVDYGAAVKIQANWRGCYVRRMLLREITHVANSTAIRFQVQWRRYRVRRLMDSRSAACLKIQAGWRRFVIGRDVIEFSKQMATLNRCTAGCIARLVISRKRSAIYVFQKLVASHISRLHLKKKKLAAAKLQSRIKGFLQRAKAKQREKAARRIQACVRGVKDNEMLIQNHYWAKYSQAVVRQHLNSKWILKRKLASALIASRWKGYAIFKKRRFFHQIVFIQAKLRGYVTRLWLKRMRPAVVRIGQWWRARRAQEDILIASALVQMIQSYVRRRMAVKAFRRRVAAAYCCQRLRKGLVMRRSLAKRRAATTFIQAYYRGRLHRLRRIAEAATVVRQQRQVRFALARKQKNYRTWAVAVISAAWHSRMTRNWLRRLKAAVLRLQAAVRGRQGMKHPLDKRSALRINVLTRIIKMKQGEKTRLKKNIASSIISAAFKAFSQRKFYLKQKRAAVALQSFRRRLNEERLLSGKRALVSSLQGVVEGRRLRESRELKSDAAITITCAWRASLARHRASEMFQSSSRTSKWLRGRCDRVRLSLRWSAATTIQKFVRRRQATAVARARAKAVRKFATVARIWSSRLPADRRARLLESVAARAPTRRDEHCFDRHFFTVKRKAALLIQTRWRMWIRRKRFDGLTGTPESDVNHIQAFWRLALQRTHTSRDVAAVVLIQRIWRGYLARICSVAITTQYVLRIQECARIWLISKLVERRRAAASKIQRKAYHWLALKHKKNMNYISYRVRGLWLSWVATRRCREMRAAAHLIGCSARKHLAMISADIRRRAALKITTAARGYLGTRRLENIWRITPVKIQSAWRKRRDARRMELERLREVEKEVRTKYTTAVRQKDRRSAAIVQLQSAMRTYVARRALARKQNAGLIVQCAYRCHLARTTVALHRWAPIYIQKMWRGSKERTFLKRRAALLVRMQRRFKMALGRYHQRRRVPPSDAFRHNELRKIQAAVRGWLLRLRHAGPLVGYTRFSAGVLELRRTSNQEAWLMRATKAKLVTALARLWRRKVGMRERARWHAAATLIQRSIARPFFACQIAKDRRRFALKLKTAGRGWLSRIKSRRRCAAALFIQAFIRARRYLVTSPTCLTRRHASATLIQSVARRAVGKSIARTRLIAQQRLVAFGRSYNWRRRLRQEHAAAVVIQLQVRARRRSRRVRQARSAAALIQTHWHSKKVGDFARRAHEVLRTRLNSMARGFLWRKRLPLFNPAALYIQRCFRGYMSRLRIPIRNAAATVIQKYQRRRQLCPSLMRSWYLMKDWLIRLIRHRAFRLHMLNIKKAVCMCESAFLRYKPIRVKKDYKTQMINIQCWIRGLRVRFEMKRKQWAARTIQGVVKIFAAKHVLAQRRASGLLLGSAILMRYRRNQYKQALRRICKAQSAAKKLCARNKFHRMRACQIRIAAWYRGIAERQSVKEWLVARGRIIPVVTSFHVKRYAVPRFRRQLRAIVKMQSLARYLLALKRLERIFMAAAQIQVAMRGYLVRKDFLRKRRACLKLQSGRWMVAAVRRLAFMHVAATRVQAGWRGYCGRHMVKTMRRLATRLVYRWQAILLERRTRHYLMLMQRFKIWLNTPTYRGLNATAIQTIWRRYSCEKRFQKQKVAVVKIQAVWRGTQVPTRSRRGAFNVRYLFSRPRVVVEDEEGRLTKLAPFGTQEADGPVHEIVDLPKLSKRQRRLLNQYMRSVLKFMGFIDDDM